MAVCFSMELAMGRSFDAIPNGTKIQFRQDGVATHGSVLALEKQGDVECDVFVVQSPDKRDVKIDSVNEWEIRNTTTINGGTVSPDNSFWYKVKAEVPKGSWCPTIEVPEDSLSFQFVSKFDNVNLAEYNYQFIRMKKEETKIYKMASQVRIILLERELLTGQSVQLMLECKKDKGTSSFTLYSANNINITNFFEFIPDEISVTLPNWPETSVEDVNHVVEIKLPDPIDTP